MAPLIVLIVVSLVARALGWAGAGYVAAWPSAVAVGLAAMFLMTALTHFIPPERRAGLIAIVPPKIPAPAVAVTVTGLLELAGAIGLLVTPLRPAAAIGLGLLLVAMFPANIYAATEQRHPSAPHTPLVPRLAYQLIFLAACLIVTTA
jgi:uncharacterized membrane protein